MYGLRIGKEIISLPKKTAVPYELNSGLFQMEKLDPSFTHPITLPNTAQVSRIFDFPHVIGVSNDIAQTYDNAALTIDGNDYWKGIVEIIDATKKEVKLTFRFGSGYLATQGKDKTLASLFPDDTVAITIESDSYLYVNYNIAAHNGFYFEHLAETIFVAADPVPAGVMTTLRDAIIAKWPAVFEIWTGPSMYGGSSWLRLGKISAITIAPLAYSRLHEDGGEGGAVHTWPYEFEETPEILQGTSGVLTSADLDVKFCLPTMYIPNLYNGENEAYRGFVNLYVNGEYQVQKIQNLTSYETTLIPCLLDKWLLPEIIKRLGLTVTGDLLANAELMNRHLFVPRTIDKELQFESFDGTVNIEVPVVELLPYMTVRDYLRSSRIEQGLHYTFDHSQLSLDMGFSNNLLTTSNKKLLQGQVIEPHPVEPVKYRGLKMGFTLDQSDLIIKNFALPRENIQEDFADVADIATRDGIGAAIYGNIVFVTSKNAWYKKNGILAADWEVHAYNIDAYRDGDEKEKLISAFTPLLEFDIEEDGRFMRCPWVEVVGYSPAFGLNDIDNVPRFGIYRGLQQDSEGANYPMSSLHNYTYGEVQIVGANYSYCWAKSTGNLLDSFLPNYKKFVSKTKAYGLQILMDKEELRLLDTRQKFNQDSVDYLVAHVDGALTDHEKTIVSLRVLSL